MSEFKNRSSQRIKVYLKDGDLRHIKHYSTKNSIDFNGCFLDKKKRRALHLAAKYGQDCIVAFLLRNGADCLEPDVKKKYPLHYALEYCLRNPSKNGSCLTILEILC